MRKWTPLLVVGGIILLLIFMLMGSYNGFVSANENVDQSWSKVESQLQRRMDLIPNLVNTVQGFTKHESEVIKSITDARAKLAGAGTPADKAAANNELSSALSRLLVVVENYPNLKSDQHFTQLMDELAGTENRLTVARNDYNTEVAVYNKKVKRFPGALIAGIFGFDAREYFKAAPGAEQAPKVDFGGNG